MKHVNYTGAGPESHGVAHTEGHEGDAVNAIRYVVDAYPGEPLFVLRGRDIRAERVIRYYAHGYAGDPEMFRQAHAHADRFMDFARGEPGHMKYADAYPGWNQVA